MHLADALDLPAGYVAVPYRGIDDLAEMLPSLVAYRFLHGHDEMPTLEQMHNSYAHLTDCDVTVDLALLRASSGEPVGYCRAHHTDLADGARECYVFAPTHPDHLRPDLFGAVVDGMERHMAERAADAPGGARYRAFASHPGPGQEPTGEAAWLEDLGYAADHWAASLRRPHLDDVPDLPLPESVEVRPVTPDQVRHIWEVHHEAFRGEWAFYEVTEDEIDEMIADPFQDPSLWQVAWAGDTVVGQVKPFVNHAENEARGYRRAYTEYISTHADWRNRGIASALLARALVAVRERGMTEAVLGVDTDNPGGAFHVYQRLGFEVTRYEAAYGRTPGPRS